MNNVSTKKNIPRQRKQSVVRLRKKAVGKGGGILEISLLVLFGCSFVLVLALYLRG